MRISAKTLVIGAGVLLLALAIGLGTQGTAQADPPDPFPAPGDGVTTIPVFTEAEVTGTGTPPDINYKWENVDMDPAEGVWAYFDGAGNADDDPTNAILDFWPWLGDDPEPLVLGKETRLIRYWAAVSDPNGLTNIAGVWVNVFEPLDDDGDTLVDEDGLDGEISGATGLPMLTGVDDDGDTDIDEDPVNMILKYQRPLAEVDCSAVGDYDPTTTPPTITLSEALLAAIQTGQLTLAEAEDIVTKCYKEEKKIYMWEDNVSKDQPAGEYRVEVNANDAQGNAATPKVNNFTVLSIVGLVIDFAAGVDFLEILPDTEQIVSGDEDMGTDDAPTVLNIGNDPMYLWLHWYTMTGQNVVPPKDITRFDATFQGEKLYFDASVQRGFCEHLCSNELKQLDLSVEPPLILPTDVYEGSLDVMGAHKADPECAAAPPRPQPPWAP